MLYVRVVASRGTLCVGDLPLGFRTSNVNFVPTEITLLFSPSRYCPNCGLANHDILIDGWCYSPKDAAYREFPERM